MLLLGIDVGTSSIKISVVDAQSQQCLASAVYPEAEAEIIAEYAGWAEQSPDQWWENVQQAILKCHATNLYDPADIAAIGVAYQMHGLVLVNKEQQAIRNAIIWCDSRAVTIGEKAFNEIGQEKCLHHLLNSPGNFTASKLAWVKENEPTIYDKIDLVMLPGDFIAMKLTGEITTTSSALSEGIFWDYANNEFSKDILRYFDFDATLFPSIHPLFSPHGYLKEIVASRLLLKSGIPISYKAGDQPNNAFSLNVLHPGEVAATAGTSGVIYGIGNELAYDQQSRINSFAHVNHTHSDKRIGTLLCINGVGIFNRWIKNIFGTHIGYDGLNKITKDVPAGSDGLMALPFGNGAERMLNNKIIGGQFIGLDFNIHQVAHLARAVQEGIAFSFRYGLDIMRENGINPSVIRAGKANLFLSDTFTQSFANVNNVAVEFYDGDGSFGAAIGAGIGAGIYKNEEDAMQNRQAVSMVEPAEHGLYDALYKKWKQRLMDELHKKQ